MESDLSAVGHVHAEPRLALHVGRDARGGSSRRARRSSATWKRLNEKASPCLKQPLNQRSSSSRSPRPDQAAERQRQTIGARAPASRFRACPRSREPSLALTREEPIDFL